MNGETQEMAQQKPALWTKQFVTLTLASFLLFLNLQMLLSTFSMHIKGNLSGGYICKLGNKHVCCYGYHRTSNDWKMDKAMVQGSSIDGRFIDSSCFHCAGLSA